MVHSQRKYRCNIVNEQKEYGSQIKNQEWLKIQVQLHPEKGTERIEGEDQYLVRMKVRELWYKKDRVKIIGIRAVQIARGEEVYDGERFICQIWK